MNAIREDQWPCSDARFPESEAWLVSIIILWQGDRSRDSHTNAQIRQQRRYNRQPVTEHIVPP
jgi:hypothetical protein